MSTRRERLEARVEKRREWADGRRQKSSGLLAQNERFRGDIAFNTQPGHIPERARAIRRSEKANEHHQMAEHHEEKASGLEQQLDRSVFSDDVDAIEQLEARIAEREAERDRMKKVNALYRKGDAAGLMALGLDLEKLRAKVASVGLSFVKVPYEAWQLTNLGATIRRDRERIEEIKRRQQRSAGADAAGGVLLTYSKATSNLPAGTFVTVTFSEKPERAILADLRSADFTWGGGSWVGYAANLPQSVQELADVVGDGAAAGDDAVNGYDAGASPTQGAVTDNPAGRGEAVDASGREEE